jgi:hypothetical protein
MHGDEPTHTLVLLDLLNFLVRAEQNAVAEEILAGCTLYVLPLVNPDGAAVRSRTNAQGIDINRDAQQAQSPEGQVLRTALAELKPDFAFNLHNQNARSTVGDTKLASTVALLAPPLNAENSQLPHVIRAKQVAACFLRAVEPLCPGQVSRYDADYMPRCFGEWAQAQGASTILVEAGGMPAEHTDRSAAIQLVEIHLVGLATALRDIATQAYQQADPGKIDALPRNGEHPLFDLLLPQVKVLNGRDARELRVDLGVNFPQGMRVLGEDEAGGRFAELGDLSVTSGKEVLDVAGHVCLPGRIVFCDRLDPTRPPGPQDWVRWFAQGVTTVIGLLDPRDRGHRAALRQFADEAGGWPGNLGWLVRCPSPPATDQFPSEILQCLADGALAVACERAPVALQPWVERSLVHAVNPSDLPKGGASGAMRDLAGAAYEAAVRLGITHPAEGDARGALLRNYVADVLVWSVEPGSTGVDWGAISTSQSQLRAVVVGGRVVWTPEGLRPNRPGRLVSSRLAQLGRELSG